MKKLILAALLFFPTVAYGFNYGACTEELSVRGGGWSKHFISSHRSSDKGWNETHYMAGVQCNGLGISTFTNSWDKESYEIHYEFRERTLFNSNKLTYRWTIGASTGYEDVLPGGVLPLVLPKIEYKITKHISLESLVTPVVVTGNVKIRF